MMRAEKTAKLYYGDGQFDVLEPGSHVVCAVTGARVPLDELRYWSVSRQEPYRSLEAAVSRHQSDSKS